MKEAIPEAILFADVSNYEEAVLDLIRAVETDSTPVLDPRIARHVVDIMCTIPEAIKEKRTLSLHTTF